MAGEKSYTPYELAAAERISRAMLYKLWSQGKGPRFYLVGNRRRIAEKSRLEWRRQLEANADARTSEPEAAA